MNTTIKTSNFCQFADIGLDEYQCINCGTIITSYDGGVPVLLCSFGSLNPLNDPNACSEEQLLKRYSVCSGCEWFQNNACAKCGCRISRNIEFRNKILWKNESCPINKWGSEI